MIYCFVLLCAAVGFWLWISHKETFQGHVRAPLVIFDFDGTLCPSFPLFLDQINYFNLRDLSTKEKERLKEMRPKELLKFLGVSSLRLPFLVQKAKKNVRQRLLELEPVPGMVELLKTLKARNISIGILTSNSEENVHSYLQKYGIDFDFIYTGNNLFGKTKHLQKILKKGNLSPQDAIYIGDEIRDMEAAAAVSILSGGVTWGYNSKKLLQESNPDFLCETPQQLAEELTSTLFHRQSED